MKSLACGAYTVGGGGVEKGEYQFADLKRDGDGDGWQLSESFGLRR